jgi:SAM-dependent methyltransferase
VSKKQATRSSPSPWHANYLPLRALAVQLRAHARVRLNTRSGLRVLDVGCGDRPYEEILRPYAGEYVGVDRYKGPLVDVVAKAEMLPFPDAGFDCFLCSQVLEHAADPAAVLSEASRVLRPGGIAFVSTHGVANYHPNPEDYWRWTHAGLARLIHTTGSWSVIDVIPNGGTGSALTYLIGRQTEVLAAKVGVAFAVRPVVLALNVAGWNADRIYRRAYPTRAPDLSPNYLAVAVRAEEGDRLRSSLERHAAERAASARS